MNASRAGRLGYVQLFNESRTSVIRNLSPAELSSEAAKGRIAWFTKQNGKSAVYLCIVPRQSRKYGEGLPSAVTLTLKDVELNAAGAANMARRTPGFNIYERRDDEIVGNAVDRSMSKVESWPEVYDTRNVVICAGRVMQPQQVQA